MSDIGRWAAIDPLSEKYMRISPYAYVANNPIKAYDPDGKRIYYVNDEGELKRATRKLLKTLTGGETYKKYLRSKTEDVYIASTKLDSEASGRTVKNAHEKNQYGISVNKNLKGVSMYPPGEVR